MSEQKLFNSKSAPIPPLRRDLQAIPVKENGDTYLYFHDERGYAASELAIRRDAAQLLTFFDGTTSIVDIKPNLGENISENDLLQFVQVLDKHGLLASNYFENHAREIENQYEQSTIHHSVTAGSSYPKDPMNSSSFWMKLLQNILPLILRFLALPKHFTRRISIRA